MGGEKGHVKPGIAQPREGPVSVNNIIYNEYCEWKKQVNETKDRDKRQRDLHKLVRKSKVVYNNFGVY